MDYDEFTVIATITAAAIPLVWAIVRLIVKALFRKSNRSPDGEQ